MNDTITFTGVVLKSFSRNKNGGKATFHSNYPMQTVAQGLGWGGITDGQTSVTLEGKLAASNCTLQPKDGALKKWCIELSATGVGSFQALRLETEGKKGKGYRLELRFIVEFSDMTACRYLEEFITHVGEAKSTLQVSYTKQAEQTELAIGDTTLDEERRQATMSDE